MDPTAAPLLASLADPKGGRGLPRHSNDPAAARAAAQQFGALLMQNILQQPDGSGLPLVNGVGGGVVNSMFASTMSRVAMSGERMGLTNMLLRSILQKQQSAGGTTADSTLSLPNSAAGTAGPAPSAPGAGAGFPLSPYWQAGGLRPLSTAAAGRMPGAVAAAAATATMPGSGLPLNARVAALLATAAPAAAPPSAAPGGPATGSSAPAAANRGGGATPQQVADFIRQVGPLMQEAGKQLGVSPRILLAQAAIETGWGRSVVGNNLFGIKAGSSWTGTKVSAATHEYENGQLVSINDDFRAYPGFAESVQDFVGLVSHSRRYQAAIGSGEDAGGYARALLAGGWATDINYVRKLEAVAGGRHATAAFAMPPGPAAAPATTAL